MIKSTLNAYLKSHMWAFPAGVWVFLVQLGFMHIIPNMASWACKYSKPICKLPIKPKIGAEKAFFLPSKPQLLGFKLKR